MYNMLSCPSQTELAEFLRGDLNEPEISEVVHHLETCPRCEAIVRELYVDDTVLEIATGNDRPRLHQPDDERIIDSLVEQLSSWDISDPSITSIVADNRLFKSLDDLGLTGRAQLGPYILVGVLGQGGMSVVFKAKDQRLKRYVALKVLRSNSVLGDAARELMLSEAQAIAIEHENIVPVYDIGEERDVTYLAMQLLHGETLEARLRREHFLDVATTISIARQVVSALQFASARGFVHRDITPSNIWIETSSEGTKAPRIKVLDFGLVGILNCRELADTKLLLGTPPYMSPEQVVGNASDIRSDLFSLGCVMYRMLIGKSPFHAATKSDILQRVLEHTPESPSQLDASIPVPVSNFVMQLLCKETNVRPSVLSAAKTLSDLENTSNRRTRKNILVAAGLLAIAAIALLSTIYIKTNTGTLVVEIFNQDVHALIDGHKIAITSPQHNVELSVGDHLLEVRKDGFKTLTKEFSLSRGDEVEVKVRLEPNSDPIEPAPSTKEFKVSSQANWTSTGIAVTAGTRVHISATGTIQAAPDSDAREYYHDVPPQGREELHEQFPYPQLRGLGLLARIGNGPVQAVGEDATLVVSIDKETGVLYLGVNDDIVDDNEGHWLVKVELTSNIPPD